MKPVKLFVLIVLMMITTFVNGQVINWSNLRKKERNIFSLYSGAEYGLVYGIGYGYVLPVKKPTILNIDYSFPSGKELFDDFKTRTGGQVNWFHTKNFYLSSKLQAIFRRYNNSYARLVDFGADLSVTGGYYKTKWFVAGELGFDKAIVTHFKHSPLYKENFPGVKDGWYEPSTGGNIYYGLQASYSWKNKDLWLRAGKINRQNLASAPMLPVYATIGVTFRRKGK